MGEAASVMPNHGMKATRSRIPTGWLPVDTSPEADMGVHFKDEHDVVDAASIADPDVLMPVRARVATGFMGTAFGEHGDVGSEVEPVVSEDASVMPSESVQPMRSRDATELLPFNATPEKEVHSEDEEDVFGVACTMAHD